MNLEGAWSDVTYYVTITPIGPTGDGIGGTSDGVQIAELEHWDGESTGGLNGGNTEDWPESGVTAFYGAHHFETVSIGADTTVMVQGFGAEDGVQVGVAAEASSVLDPSDGWLMLYANTILVEGTITASGRGYGGGGGAAGYLSTSAYGGHGGSNGLGGTGDDGGYCVNAPVGGGGGGSPSGAGGVYSSCGSCNSGGTASGGRGNLFGRGGGGAGCPNVTGGGGAGGAPSGVASAGSESDVGGSNYLLSWMWIKRPS